MSQQSKTEFALNKITELTVAIANREGIPMQSQSFDDLQWINFYAKELVSKCKGCEETHSGSKLEDNN